MSAGMIRFFIVSAGEACASTTFVSRDDDVAAEDDQFSPRLCLEPGDGVGDVTDEQSR
jgi:hypothetical protein